MENSSPKLKMLSEIFRDMGQVFFASLLIGPLVIGTMDGQLILWGAVLSFASWYFSLLLIKE
ncbi:MAG: hypothetical protein Q8L09_00570 [Candidatus Moranbacteria bacterium]|jgi:hypothetical protein|nr:hypothetical protein [Candidatus Moranbacteria bacterium]